MLPTLIEFQLANLMHARCSQFVPQAKVECRVAVAARVFGSSGGAIASIRPRQHQPRPDGALPIAGDGGNDEGIYQQYVDSTLNSTWGGCLTDDNGANVTVRAPLDTTWLAYT